MKRMEWTVAEDNEIYTPTMARVYAGQGYLKQAADIYRRLLETDPEREDWRHALADIEQGLAQEPETATDLSALFGDWIDLVHRYNHLKKLKKIRKKPIDALREGRRTQQPTR